MESKGCNQRAYFGMACFWGAEARLGWAAGVLRTRVGYCGGEHPRPNYPRIYDHTEVVEVEYDPASTSYSNLLDLFWTSHDPSQSKKRQYMSVIFYTDSQQKELAEKSKAEKERDLNIVTKILPLTTFHQAEDYHQKYLLKSYHTRFLKELSIDDLVMSSKAARLNGYLAGYGSLQELEKEGMELTPLQMEYVRTHRKQDHKGVAPLLKTIVTVGCCHVKKALGL